MSQSAASHPTVTVEGRTFCGKYADLLPARTPEEKEELRASIKQRGRVYLPVVVNPKDEVIDGWARLMIAGEEGLALAAVPVQVEDVAPDDEAELAVMLNFDRRQMTREQRVEFVRKLRAMGWSTRRIAKATGLSKSTADRIAADVDVESVVGEDGKTRAAKVPTVPFGTVDLATSSANEAKDEQPSIPATPVEEADGEPLEDVEPPPANIPAEDVELPQSMDDSFGQPVPANLFPVFHTAGRMRVVKQEAGKLFARLEELKMLPGGRKLSMSSVQKAVEDFQNSITSGLPVAVCPDCQGVEGGCKTCDGQGWLWQSRLGGLSPKQMRHLERFRVKRTT